MAGGDDSHSGTLSSVEAFNPTATQNRWEAVAPMSAKHDAWGSGCDVSLDE